MHLSWIKNRTSTYPATVGDKGTRRLFVGAVYDFIFGVRRRHFLAPKHPISMRLHATALAQAVFSSDILQQEEYMLHAKPPLQLSFLVPSIRAK